MSFYCLLFIPQIVKSQDLTGSWSGSFHYVVKPFEGSLHFFVDIKQKGKSVWGVYNITEGDNPKTVTCICSFSGILPKKTSAEFELPVDQVQDKDKNSKYYVTCGNVQRLSFHYIIIDSVEMLVGKWFPLNERLQSGTPDGESGYFILRHASPQPNKNPDQYFPKLEKLIAKGAPQNSGNTEPVLIADSLLKAPMEIKMVKSLLEVVIPKN